MGGALSICQYCLGARAFSLNEACYQYQSKLSGENEAIADWLVALTKAN